MRVDIVQPYVPRYRVEFFERLIESLAREGVTVRVLAGRPSGDQALRSDAVVPPWVTPIEQFCVRVPGGTVSGVRGRRPWRGVSGVVLPLIGSSPDFVRALADRAQGSRLGLWGHVGSYVARGSRIDLAAERWMMRRADHVFAYTPLGGLQAELAGVDPTRISVVMNAGPTDALEAARDAVNEAQVASFRTRYGLGDAPLLAVVGGLDHAKRLDLLCRSLDVLHESDPDVKVVVAGAGAGAAIFDESVARGQTVLVGYAGPEQLATIAAASRALANPGRIGLVAVDALVLGLPVVTAAGSHHGPEVEYLTEGSTLITAADHPEAFATALATAVRASGSSMSTTGYPTVAGMAERFSRGVLTMLG